MKRIIFMLLWIILFSIFFYRFVVNSSVIEGISMSPTLDVGSTHLVNRYLYYFKNPERGDIIVLSKKQEVPFLLIKRIIGIPGDSVRIRGGEVYVNGKKLNESYTKGTTKPSIRIEKLGENEYFVLGDNREYSDDSRFWGPLHRKEIIGKVSEKGLFTFW